MTAEALRTSSYTIYVDLPWTADEVLLVHGYSGAYDAVGRDVANYVRSRETAPAGKPLYGMWSPEPRATAPTPPAEVIDRLERRGFLTSLDAEQERARLIELSRIVRAKRWRTRPSFIVMPTYQCNLRCGYCFQDHMRTDPRYAHLLEVMQPQMFERILTAMDALDAHQDATEPRSITLFGGEPLMRENRAVIEHIVERALVRKPTTFDAITNGTDLAAYRDLLGPTGISWVQITLDGTPSVHDTRRVYADGSGSYQLIADNIDMCLAQGVEVSLRINVDRDNARELPMLARELSGRGWTKHPAFSAGVAPVTGSAAGFTSWKLVKLMDELASEHPEIGALMPPGHGLYSDLVRIFHGEQSPYSQFRDSHCEAHRGMYVFDCFGDIYACWERTGDRSMRVGWVDEDGAPHLQDGGSARPPARATLPMFKPAPASHAEWRNRTIEQSATCSRCRYALHCGGGCAVAALETTGNFYGNHCDGFQSTFRATAARAYRAFLDGARPASQVRSLCGA
jgi:uncharacterized protein